DENPITRETLESLETIPFKVSIEQILKFNKNITVRSNFIKKGTYREILSNRALNIYPQGNLYLNQYLAMTGMDIEEFKRKFFGESFEDSKLKEDHIVSFFNNEIPLEIYTITPITKESEVIINVVDARFKSLIERREKQLKLLKTQLRNATN